MTRREGAVGTVVYADELVSLGEVGVKPGQCCASEVERGFQLGEQDGLLDGVKGCCEIREGEDVEVSAV